jgi:SWI/SNF-related matrix-associated actin-dependent regulator of chromatin subfamily A3
MSHLSKKVKKDKSVLFETEIYLIRVKDSYSLKFNIEEPVELLRHINSVDKNAIRVHIKGVLLGYLPKGMASILAPLMDSSNLDLNFEAVVNGAYTGFFSYRIPLKLTVSGSAELDKSKVSARLQGVITIYREHVKEMESYRQATDLLQRLKPRSAITTFSNSQIPINNSAVTLELIESNIDKLFKDAVALDSMLEASQPLSIITPLKTHQLMGLHFMTEREKTPSITFEATVKSLFWKRLADGNFINSVTNAVTTTDPTATFPLGGIIADEMGLGKTLLVISMMAEEKRIANTKALTLVVTPVSVLQVWQQQIETHVSKAQALKVAVYHGNQRHAEFPNWVGYDVVLTTYGTLSAEFDDSKSSILFTTKFCRLVLDEGHIIKNDKAKIHRACCSVQSTIRWVLTGTPIVNKIEDLRALLQFIRVRPFSDSSTWDRLIKQPLKEAKAEGFQRLQALTVEYTLRRVKSQLLKGKPILELPAKSAEVIEIEWDARGQKVYDALLSFTKTKVSRWIKEETAGQNYVNILVLILRLRQVCNSLLMLPPLLLEQLLSNHNSNDALDVSDSAQDCCVCLDQFPSKGSVVVAACSHTFCTSCFNEGYLMPCPECGDDVVAGTRLPVVNEDVTRTAISSDNRSSPKINALITLLLTRKEGVKSVVFSQWTSMLDLVGPALSNAKIKFTRIDGSMDRVQRAESIAFFSSNSDCSVFLATLGTGGIGLDLTCASEVYILDPWWNVAREDQACDRIHRLGQRFHVTVRRLVIQNSIEKRLLELQSTKSFAMAAAFGSKPIEELKHKNIEGIKLLLELG